MGREVLEIRCRKGMQEEFQAGNQHPAACVFDNEVVYRRRLAPGVAHEVADEEVLKQCLADYIEQNPNSGVEFPSLKESLQREGTARISLAQEATKCILRYGRYWKIPH